MVARLALGFSLVLLLPIAGLGLGTEQSPISDPSTTLRTSLQSLILRLHSGQASNPQPPIPNLQSPISNPQSLTGRRVYEEDFSDPDSGWPVSDSHDVTYAYTEGEYQIFVREQYDWAGAHVDLSLSDYIVEADARCATDRCRHYGLVFGLNDDWSEFYALVINNRREYTVWKYYAEHLQPLMSGWRFSRYIESRQAWNHLRVVRQGADITIMANDHTLTTVRDGTLTGLRRTGVFVYSGDGRLADVRFDNFRLSTLAEGVDYIEHKAIWASSADRGFGARLAVDGNDGTRWSSASSEEFQYLIVDAGAEGYTYDQVVVDWAEAEAKRWGVIVWNGSDWEWVALVPDNLGGIESLEFDPHQGRLWGLIMWGWTEPWSEYSLWEWELRGPAEQTPNLALRKPAFASSVEDNFEPEYAVDGELNTYWSSGSSSEQWLLLDLEQTLPFDQATIVWKAHAEEYGILVWRSDHWEWLARTDDGHGGTERSEFERTIGRWLLVYGRRPTQESGYAIWEISVRDTVGGGRWDNTSALLEQPEDLSQDSKFPSGPDLRPSSEKNLHNQATTRPPAPNPSLLQRLSDQ